MISLPDDLPDDPVLLKQMLLEALNRQEEVAQAYQAHIVDLKEQIKLLRDRLFGRKSEQTAEPKVRFRGLVKNTAQMMTLFALSNLWMARRHLLTSTREVRL